MNLKELLRHSRLRDLCWFIGGIATVCLLLAVLRFIYQPTPKPICWEPVVTFCVVDTLAKDRVFVSANAETVRVFVGEETAYMLISGVLDLADAAAKVKSKKVAVRVDRFYNAADSLRRAE